jgi:RNA polymerase sigma-70 factor (ECF subfamily)
VERDGAFDRDALSCLPEVARFARSLTRNAVDAADLVQETYLRAYKGHATFRRGGSMRSWLFSICHHAWRRDAQRRRRIVLDADTANADAETLDAVRDHAAAQRSGLDQFFTTLDLGPAIQEAIDDLDPVFRGIVLLVDVEGMRYAEAADILGVPLGTVRSRLFRARRLLQERLFAHARDAGIVQFAAPASHHSGR